MKSLLRIFVVAHAAALLTGPAVAADFPSKTIRLIIGNAPGGPTDLAARVYADKLRPMLGQSAVVEPRVGANSQIAIDALMKSEADGHTLFYGGAAFATLPITSKTYTVEVTKDVIPVSLIVSGINGIGVHPSAPFKTVDEWIAHLRTNPGKLNYANIAAPDMLSFEIIRTAMGVRFETIRYNGATPAAQAVMAGQADFYTATIGILAKGFVESGRLRIIGVMDSKRSPIMPEIPSFNESSDPKIRELGQFTGLGGFYFGVTAPAGTPREVVNRIHQVTLQITKDKDFEKKMNDMGLTVEGTSPEQFLGRITGEIARFREAAKSAGIQPQ